MSDLDLLVRPSDLDRAIEVLVSYGYEFCYSGHLRLFVSV
jgi:hypothetical protein